MLLENMSLKNMLDYKPSDLDMAMLPLDVIVYVKVTLVSKSRQENCGFIRYLFSSPELNDRTALLSYRRLSQIAVCRNYQ